jgi:hypothetical protein
MRKNGNSNIINMNAVTTQVLNIENHALFLVPCDTNQVVEYWATAVAWVKIDITIMGWFTAGGSAGGDVCADNDITDQYLTRGDGGAKKIEECTVRVDDSGHMTNPSQPAFSVKPTAAQTNIATDEYVDVVFGTEIFDQSNDFASNTFLAAVSGRYQLNVVVWVNQVDTDSSNIQISLPTSNRSYYARLIPNFSADVSFTFVISVLADMDANDSAKVQIYCTGGAAQVDIDDNSYFTGALIC